MVFMEFHCSGKRLVNINWVTNTNGTIVMTKILKALIDNWLKISLNFFLFILRYITSIKRVVFCNQAIKMLHLVFVIAHFAFHYQ